MRSTPLEDLAIRPRDKQAWETHLGREVDVQDLRSELSFGTLIEGFDASAEANLCKTALIIDDRAATHGEIRSLSKKTATWLKENGVKHGTAVLLYGKNSLDLVVAYVAVLRLGGFVVSASPAAKSRELERLAAGSRPLIALGDIEQLEALRSIDVGVRPRVIAALSTASRTDGDQVKEHRCDAQDVASVAFTSGTTGTPKAAPLTHANQLATIRGAMLAWRWSSDDVLVHTLPLSHGHGLGGLHATLLAGSTAVISSKFNPRSLCENIEVHSASVLFAVPAIYQRLVDWGGFGSADLSSLRLPISGSAPLPSSLALKVANVLGQLPLERYGTTETGLDISNPYEGERRPGSVGLALPGVEVAMVDEEGVPVRDGENGEIVLRGPQVFGGYLGKGNEGFLPGGWFRTGDVGRVDLPNQRIAITGRQKEMIITGGLNVFPREVELVLEAYEAVSEAAVIGLPSQRWGEEVTAFVVATPDGIDLEALAEYLKQVLITYKIPKRVVLMESLPRNPLGKILKPRLLEIAHQATISRSMDQKD